MFCISFAFPVINSHNDFVYMSCEEGRFTIYRHQAFGVERDLVCKGAVCSYVRREKNTMLGLGVFYEVSWTSQRVTQLYVRGFINYTIVINYATVSRYR